MNNTKKCNWPMNSNKNKLTNFIHAKLTLHVKKIVACFILLYLFISKQSFKILTAVPGSLQ